MPIKDCGFDEKLYFYDGVEWKEVGNLDKMHELSTEIISCDAEDAKFEGYFEGIPVFEWDYEASLKSDKSDLYNEKKTLEKYDYIYIVTIILLIIVAEIILIKYTSNPLSNFS